MFVEDKDQQQSVDVCVKRRVANVQNGEGAARHGKSRLFPDLNLITVDSSGLSLTHPKALNSQLHSFRIFVLLS